MNFERLVNYVKAAGCRVILYPTKPSLNKDRCAGYFERKKKGPFICMALADLDESSKVELLLHEFSHFLQWKDGVETRQTDNAYKLWDKWLSGKKIRPKRLAEIRHIILTHEWDAEMRSVELAKNLAVEAYDMKDVLRGANAYMATIKWCFQTRRTSSWTPDRSRFRAKVLTPGELLAPLSLRQLKRVDNLIAAANFNPLLPVV